MVSPIDPIDSSPPQPPALKRPRSHRLTHEEAVRRLEEIRSIVTVSESSDLVITKRIASLPQAKGLSEHRAVRVWSKGQGVGAVSVYLLSNWSADRSWVISYRSDEHENRARDELRFTRFMLLSTRDLVTYFVSEKLSLGGACKAILREITSAYDKAEAEHQHRLALIQETSKSLRDLAQSTAQTADRPPSHERN